MDRWISVGRDHFVEAFVSETNTELDLDAIERAAVAYFRRLQTGDDDVLANDDLICVAIPALIAEVKRLRGEKSQWKAEYDTKRLVTSD